MLIARCSRGGKDGFLKVLVFHGFLKTKKISKGRIFCFFCGFLDIVVFLYKLCA